MHIHLKIDGDKIENIQSYIGKLRDGLLNGEIFDPILEARVLTERC